MILYFIKHKKYCRMTIAPRHDMGWKSITFSLQGVSKCPVHCFECESMTLVGRFSALPPKRFGKLQLLKIRQLLFSFILVHSPALFSFLDWLWIRLIFFDKIVRVSIFAHLTYTECRSFNGEKAKSPNTIIFRRMSTTHTVLLWFRFIDLYFCHMGFLFWLYQLQHDVDYVNAEDTKAIKWMQNIYRYNTKGSN